MSECEQDEWLTDIKSHDSGRAGVFRNGHRWWMKRDAARREGRRRDGRHMVMMWMVGEDVDGGEMLAGEDVGGGEMLVGEDVDGGCWEWREEKGRTPIYA